MNNKVKVTVSKKFTFDACHQLINYVGKCHRLHGHTYTLEIGVKGYKDDRGLVIDFGDLKRIVSNYLLDGGPCLDHNNLNENMKSLDIAYEEENTTCENMVVTLFTYLRPIVAEATDDRAYLLFVKLWETPTSYGLVTLSDMQEGAN